MSAVVLVPDTETGDLFGGPSVAPLEAVAAQRLEIFRWIANDGESE
jgi:hypothetical protein